jgi:hypothetical protein
MNKRGSHVEVIISFIIFVTFVLFLLLVLEPSVKSQNDKENILDNIEFELINNLSSDMTIITINFDGPGGDCVDIDDFDIGKNIFVKDKYNMGVTSSADETSLKINKGNPSDTFFKIYYSEKFNELEGPGCSPVSYEMGLTKTEKYIFERNLLDLIEQYNNYETLKANLNIPMGVEFGYGIILSNGTTFETQRGNVSTNVYITETPIKYIDLDGNILEGFLKTKVW